MSREHMVTDINEYRRYRSKFYNQRIILILVFFLVCMVAGYFFAISGFFAIDEILVVGNQNTHEDEIVKLSGITQGENIFTVNSSGMARIIRLLPWVDSVTIRRKLPDTVIITITERSSVAVMNVGSAMVELDIDGRVLRRYQVVEAVGLPIISGIDYGKSGAMPGLYLQGDNLDEALTVLEALDNMAQVGEIDVSNANDVRLYTDTGVEIRIGDTKKLEEKLVLSSSILANNTQEQDGLIHYIDVSIPAKPIVAFVD